ncbi:MAG: hypothetical protein KKD47_03260 [Proteobacteria bacterium]|nr:hypothetical protein [Pseudomonadota bacterium]
MKSKIAVMMTALFTIALLVGCASVPMVKVPASDITEPPDIRTYSVNVEPLNLGTNEKQVSLVLVDNNAPVVNTEIILSYYDEVSMLPVLKKAKTDEKGIVSFILPGREDGASYIFRFGLSETDLSRTTAIRIPPKNLYGGHKLIILVFNKNIQVTNREGAMQLIRFPNAGKAFPSGGDIMTGPSLYTLLEGTQGK